MSRIGSRTKSIGVAICSIAIVALTGCLQMLANQTIVKQTVAPTLYPSSTPPSTPPSTPQNINPPVEAIPTPIKIETSYALINPCTKTECIFEKTHTPEVVLGLAQLRGYLSQVKRNVSTPNEQVCDAFIVVGGSDALRDRLLAAVNAGNTLNTKTENGQLAINVSLSEVSQDDLVKLQQAGESNPVSVLVLYNAGEERGTETCFAPIEVLKVN